jgi:hypothetical protein
MKKKLFVALTFAAFLSLVFIACKKEEDGAQVGYASEQGTGANPDNTSAGTTSTTLGSTTSTSGATTSSTSSTSGSTTSTPTGNYFKVNSTVYTCSSVTSTAPSGEYNIIGRSAAGDTCWISFTSIPAAGTYPHTGNLFPAAGESLVALQIGNSASGVYLGDAGNVVITVPSGTSRKATITNMTIINLSTSATATLNASLTAP